MGFSMGSCLSDAQWAFAIAISPSGSQAVITLPFLSAKGVVTNFNELPVGSLSRARLRVNVVYHRHKATLPQEDVPGQTTEEMVQDCENPEVYRVIAGLTDQFPYREKQPNVVPKVKGAPVAAE